MARIPRNRSTRPPRASRERSSPVRNATGTMTTEKARIQNTAYGTGTADETGGQHRREEQQVDAPRHARQQRAAARSRRRPPPRGDHRGDGEGDREIQPLLDGVDRGGDPRVGQHEQEVAVHLEEHQPQRRDDQQAHRDRTDDDPVHPRPQAPAAEERQQDRDEQEQPHVAQQQARRPRERRVELGEQGRGEEGEAGRGHQPAAVVVGTPPPRHQPARRERPADDPEDDCHDHERHCRTAGEQGHEHPENGCGQRAPCHDPDDEVTLGSRETPHHLRAARAERGSTPRMDGNQPARRHRAQPIIGRLLGAEPTAAVAAGLLLGAPQ